MLTCALGGCLRPVGVATDPSARCDYFACEWDISRVHQRAMLTSNQLAGDTSVKRPAAGAGAGGLTGVAKKAKT